MRYTKTQMLDLLEEAVEENAAAEFPDVETALQVAAGALNYLMNLCDEDTTD